MDAFRTKLYKYRCPIEVGRSIFDYPRHVHVEQETENFKTEPLR